MARQLETSRTILRAWRDGDVEEWVALGADARVMEFMPSLIERADAERSAQRLREGLERDGYGWWVLEVKDVASFAGVVALQNVPSDLPFTPAFEVGWRLRYDQWGRGYATEAARAFSEDKKPEQAERLLQRVVKDYPQSEWAKVAKKRLEELMK